MTAGVLPPDDPFGDRAWLAAQNKTKAKSVADDVADLVHPAIKAVAEGGAKPKREKLLPVSAIDVAISEELFDEHLVEIGRELRAEEGAKWEPDEFGMPPQSPILAVGKKKFTFYFLNRQHEIIALGAGDLGQGGIDALFAGVSGYLYWAWPRATKNRSGVAYDVVRKCLMDACAKMALRDGVFEEENRVRGRGAWKDSQGKLIMHLGDLVMIDGVEHKPGIHDGMVYPGGPRMGRPASEAPDIGTNHGRAVYSALKGWRWRRGDLDARLALGWIGQSIFSGALDWRAHMVVYGPPGAGKSSLMALIGQCIGSGLVKMEEASAPFIYQKLKHDSVPVVLDEFENDDGSMVTNVLRLVTRSSSGGSIGRGGQDGVPISYTIRSPFAVSAVTPPPLLPAEAQRVAMLGLLPHHGSEAPRLSEHAAQGFQAALKGRAIRYWPIWPQIFAAFRSALILKGHNARGADQFGTLLAGAWFATQDGVPQTHEVADWIGPLDPSQLSEVMAARPGWRRCLDHLFSSQPDMWRSGKTYRSIGALLEAYFKGLTSEDGIKLDVVRAALGEAGLALVSRPGRAENLWRDSLWLAVPDEHQALAKLFEDTSWAARRGAPGAWGRALDEMPEDVVERGRFRLGGTRARGVLIDLGGLVAGEAVFVSAADAPDEFERDGRVAGADG